MKNYFFSVYCKTLVLTLILLGSVAFSTYKIWGNIDKAQDVKNQLEERYSYIPSENEGISFLLAIENNASNHGIYALIKTQPEATKTTVAIIPWQLMGHSGTKHRNLDGFLKMSGRDILNAVNSAFGLSVKKYLLVNGESLENSLDMLGGISYDIPENVEYETENAYVKMFSGYQHLGGKMILGLLENPENFGKNTLGAENIGKIFSAIIGGQDENRLREVAEPIYKKIISSADTNLSYEDFVMRKEALFYMLKSENHSIDLITADGNFDITKDNFTPSQDYINKIKTAFNAD